MLRCGRGRNEEKREGGGKSRQRGHLQDEWLETQLMSTFAHEAYHHWSHVSQQIPSLYTESVTPQWAHSHGGWTSKIPWARGLWIAENNLDASAAALRSRSPWESGPGVEVSLRLGMTICRLKAIVLMAWSAQRVRNISNFLIFNFGVKEMDFEVDVYGQCS